MNVFSNYILLSNLVTIDTNSPFVMKIREALSVNACLIFWNSVNFPDFPDFCSDSSWPSKKKSHFKGLFFFSFFFLNGFLEESWSESGTRTWGEMCSAGHKFVYSCPFLSIIESCNEDLQSCWLILFFFCHFFVSSFHQNAFKKKNFIQ